MYSMKGSYGVVANISFLGDDAYLCLMRINRFIAHSGICARRAAEGLVRNGKILINGEVCRDLTYQVLPDDVVTYQGRVLEVEEKRYVLLNKPPRYVTTVHDPQGRPTVMHLVDPKEKVRLYPVGRLDYLTTGLLLLTNDGGLATKLSHPSKEIRKTYEVVINRSLTLFDEKKIRRGVWLYDGPVPIDDFKCITRKKIVLTIHIGRNRIIRRLFKHLGYSVRELRRTHYADLTLEGLAEGSWRWLTRKEIKKIKSQTEV